MKRIALASFALCLALTAHADATDDAWRALAERDPSGAAALLRAEVAKGGANAERHYLLARAEFLAKRYDEALTAADVVREKFAKSPFARKANFLRADCFVARKDFQRADEVYLAEAKALVSLDRKEEVAALYLRIADRAFAPPTKDEKPDWQRAERFYDLATQIGLKPDKLRQTRFRILRAKYERGAAWEAIGLASAFIKEHKTGAFVADARYTLGRAYQKVRNFSEARKAFRDFLDEHTDHALTPKAAFRVIETFRMPRPQSNPELERGVRAARIFLEKFGAHEESSQALSWIADGFAFRSRFDEAAAAYRELIERFGAEPAGATGPIADKRRQHVAQAKVRLGDALAKQGKPAAAIEVWRAYLRDHPADRDWERAQRAVLDAELRIASDHYLEKRWDAARDAWQSFLSRYPLDRRNPKVMRMLGQLEYDQGRFAEAIKAWRALVSKYGRTPDGSRAHFQLAVTLADKQADFESAMKELEAVQGNHRWQAQARLKAMKEESLKVVTERAYGTSDGAALKITQRNLPKLSLRLYKVDMEQYFRRKHRLDQVETLDLALIAPDKAWEVDVAGYVARKESELSIPLGVTEPGVYAVTVAGGKLESTTIVQVTDLALVTKATRRDLLVLALDRRSGRVFSGARVLVSNGSKIVLEGKTGADGVFYTKDKALAGLSSATVFAELEGHVAGAHTGYIGGALSVMQPRGLVYTDRPAYKPGQAVHVRAIVRRVDAGRYVFEDGEKYQLVVSAPRSGVVFRKEVALDRFGATSADFTLDPNAPIGTYHVSLSRKLDGTTVAFSGNFRVQTYRLEKVRVDVVFDRPVFMRGEKVTGRVRAAYQFGEPVAGKKLTYQLVQEGVQHEVILDEKGEAAFSFETRNFDWEQRLAVTAQLADEGVTSRGEARLATEEFVARASVDRPVYLAGDEALVTVEARDVNDKPLAARFVVDVFLRVPDASAKLQAGLDAFTREALAELRRAGAGEVRVATLETSTASDSGKAVVRHRLARGGEYVFRARAVDRFGNAIVAETTLTASGEDDAVRLRLFGIADQYRLGDTLTVRVHSRARKAEWTLVTFLADGIVEYRVVRLAPGENVLTFKLGESHAPNVRLSFALFDDGELREASADIRVERGLVVKVEPSSKVGTPGGKLKVKLIAKELSGAPAQAALSLAVVDEALFRLFADLVPSIGPHFYGQVRDTTAATAASGKARHEGTTKSVSQELLGEDQRRAEEKSKEERSADDLAKRDTGAIFAQPSSAPPPPPPAPMADSAGESALGAATGSGGMGRGRSYRSKKAYWKNGRKSVAGKPDPRVAVRAEFLELAHWAPSVVTNAQGEAEVELTLPHNTTTWRLTSRGTTVDTQVGEGRAEVVVKRDFFVEARLPASLTEGDEVKPIVRVHNTSGQGGKSDVSVTVELSGQKSARTAAVDVPGKGSVEAPVGEIQAAGFTFGRRNEAVISARATLGGNTDEERVTLPLLPFGTERRVGASGATSGTATRVLELPAGDYAQRSLTLDLGPPPNRLLVEMALSRVGLSASSAASTAHWLLTTHHVWSYLRALGVGGLDLERLREQLASLAQSLGNAQNSDGGLSWWGRGRSNLFASADGLRGLLLAKEAGVEVPDAAIARLVSYVATKFRGLGETNSTAKAALLHALAHVRDPAVLSGNQVDVFAFANRLYRMRSRLPLTALAHLTLSLDRLGRRAEVVELSGALASRATSFDAIASPLVLAKRNRIRPYFHDRVTLVALVVDAIQRGAPRHAKVKEGMAWLLARRYGLCWFSPRLTQASVEALARYYGGTRFSGDRYRVAVKVNGKPVTEVDIVGDGAHRSIEIPTALVNAGRNELSLEVSGRGEVTYAAVLTGFTRGIDAADESRWLQVRREVQPAPKRVDGKELARGFGIVSTQKPWKNSLSQLPVGERAQVTLQVSRHNSARVGYLVVEEPLPAGARVDPDSIRGSMLHHEVRPDRIVFFLDGRSWTSSLHYDLFGVIPGRYKVLPTQVYGAYDPTYLSTGKDGKLEVLPRGATSTDAYRPTPDEDFDHGKRLFDDKKFEAAAVPLERLLSGHGGEYTLAEHAHRDTVRMLLYVALAQKQPDKVVRYFEIVREKYPDLVIELEKSVEIGAAYMAMKEWERAWQVLRATLEASFNVESQVGGALDSAGEPLESVRFVRGLVNDYPDLPTVQAALYGLGQHITDLEKRAQTDENMKRFKLKKGTLLVDAIRIFWEFRALYPDNPTVDEAAFALASAYLGREDWKGVISLTERLRTLHPKSSFLDGYEYIQGLAAFALERYDSALSLCKKVSEAQYYNERKELTYSTNRDLAVFIIGQIYHSLGKANLAVERYKKVTEKFPDAREAIATFERVSLSLPEVTTVRPGQKATLKVSYRNVDEAELVVYKVDLMKLYLLHRDLNNITKVNLAGIKPKVERKVKLGGERSFRDLETTLRLPLKETGAYLVVLKAKEVEASAMVLVTDLALDVREDGGAGRVRVQVLDKKRGQPVKRVFVRVVGSVDGRFQGAETDLRGIYVAQSVRGKATVIAAKGSSYAFFRGVVDGQGGAPMPAASPVQQQRHLNGDGIPDSSKPAKGLVDELDKRNMYLNERAKQRYRQQLDNTSKGVQVEQMK